MAKRRTPIAWIPLQASIPDEQMLTWDSQVHQYERVGRPGMTVFRGVLSYNEWAECLLYRDSAGLLVGILNYYPMDIPPYEKAGNCNLWVKPENRRQGIGTKLLREALRRWPTINLQQQRYSSAGIKFIRRFKP